MSERGQPLLVRAGSSAVLLVLLALLLAAAVTFDRSRWPALLGDEATYLMAAESLAWDGDLLYTRQDFDRFAGRWQLPPEGLILQSGDGGGHITYGKPFFYPLAIAPFVRFLGTHGPFVANAVVLALAALMASRTLKKSLGAAAPLWVSAFVFASVSFAYTFWAHADLFLLALTAAALSLAFRGSDGAGRAAAERRLQLRWIVVGALLAAVVFSRPFYLPLFLPVLLAIPRGGRSRATLSLVAGAVLVVAGAMVVHRANANAWTSYGAERHGFYSSTGYPEVDFPASEWSQSVEGLGNAAWTEADRLLSLPPTDASLWRWNSLYFLVGRNVGVLPYFLPLLLGLSSWPRGVGRWALLAAAALCVVGFFLYRPFNFYGGGGALANRYFMPLYPLFWFVAARRRRLAVPVIAAVMAAPFLWPLWAAPRAFPLRSNHTYRYVSPVAVRLMPFETTQSHLKPAGRADVVHNGLWIKFLTPTMRLNREGRALLLDRGGEGQLLLGSSRPLEQLELRTLGQAGETVQVLEGASVRQQVLGGAAEPQVLTLGRLRARHPMWWTWDDVYLYQLTLRSESSATGRVTFTLRPVSAASATRTAD